MDCVKEKLYQHKNLWDEGYYEEMLLTEYLQGALASLVMQESVEGVLDKKATLISSRESQHKALLETLPLCHLYAHSGVETGNNMGLTLSLSNKPKMGPRWGPDLTSLSYTAETQTAVKARKRTQMLKKK